MGVIELPFLFVVDKLTTALGVAVGAVLVAVVCMPKFENSTLETLDRKATDRAIAEGRAPDSREFIEKNEHYVQASPGIAVGDHGTSFLEPAERSNLIDDDAMAPVKKGGR
jgi:hypothetical protein